MKEAAERPRRVSGGPGPRHRTRQGFTITFVSDATGGVTSIAPAAGFVWMTLTSLIYGE